MSDFKVKLNKGNANYQVTKTQTTPNFTLKNTTISQNRIDRMTDVIETDKVDGAVLVYDADTDTYKLRDILTYDNDTDTFRLEGGDF